MGQRGAAYQGHTHTVIAFLFPPVPAVYYNSVLTVVDFGIFVFFLTVFGRPDCLFYIPQPFTNI